MNQHEICLWVDQRWYQALSRQLNGETVEEKLNGYLDTLIHQLPPQEYERISQEIQEEDRRQKQAQEAARRFSVFRLRENGAEEFVQTEHREWFYSVAGFLRGVLREKNSSALDAFKDVFPHGTKITAAEYEQLAGLRAESFNRNSNVFDLNFDRREVSVADSIHGWQTYAMKEAAAAVSLVTRKRGLWPEQYDVRLMNRLDGRQIASSGHLSTREISFAEEISEVGSLLNFYLETNFDVDAVFGTHVCTGENADWVNVYANYDMAAGEICGELEIALHRGDGSEEALAYPLNAVEKTVLLRKMEDYCQRQTGQSLSEYSAQWMTEELSAQPSM